MIDAGEMLLVADGPMGAELTGRLGEGRSVRCGDPYDALLEMSHRRWSAVVVTAPRPDLAGLCRAIKRLQQDVRVYGVCPPAGEPELRDLIGRSLDDYFIYPPTDSDVRRMIAGASGADSTGRDQAAAIAPREFAEMLEAARTVGDLESHIASIVARRCGTPALWVDADRAAADVTPLLLAAGDVPRVLVPRASYSGLDEAARKYISAVQDCLPSLMATARRTQSLHRLAIIDHLTGAYNRRYFYHATDRILARAGANSFRVTLLLFDIDDFKRYNDAYGHAAGDEILRETTRLIRRTTRSHDIVARIGGDEFAVLFWDPAEPRHPNSKSPEAAYVVAERFRAAVSRHEFPSLGPEARGALTISGGLATFPAGGRTCRDLLRTADGALRGVKKTGKNAFRLIGS